MRTLGKILPWLVLLMDCGPTCRDLGYEFFTQDRYGCICAEHVDSLRLISNFTLRYTPAKKEPEDQKDDRPPAPTYGPESPDDD